MDIVALAPYGPWVLALAVAAAIVRLLIVSRYRVSVKLDVGPDDQAKK